MISFHVPLVEKGESPWPTRDLIGASELTSFKKQLIVNTARGDVFSLDALLNLKESMQCDLAFDVFPNEPSVSKSLLGLLWQATPHIAGHSARGKWWGTYQVFQAFCRWANWGNIEKHKGMNNSNIIHQLWANSEVNLELWYELSRLVVPLSDLNRQMKALMQIDDIVSAFRQLRRSYKPRAEWSDVVLAAPLLVDSQKTVLHRAGIGRVDSI